MKKFKGAPELLTWKFKDEVCSKILKTIAVFIISQNLHQNTPLRFGAYEGENTL